MPIDRPYIERGGVPKEWGDFGISSYNPPQYDIIGFKKSLSAANNFMNCWSIQTHVMVLHEN